MTIEATKIHLIAALAEDENKVIALSGRWGTGKSHLWEEIQEETGETKIKGALYVSLFGLNSLDQVKFKLVQCAIPVASENPRLFDSMNKSLGFIRKALEGFNKGFSALGELGGIALLLALTILKNRIIVIDDIERKQSTFSVDELLGFIDEFTKRHGVRFLLILNTDRLEDKPIWERLREKVIDLELKMETSPDESFDIAIRETPSRYALAIKAASLECGLTNIRIVRKVIRSVNRLLDKWDDLSDAVLKRIIPSIVLLSAIHYRGIENGPSIEFVLAAGSIAGLNPSIKDEEKTSKELEDIKRKSEWNLLLNRLQIYASDEFELLVADYLESGLFQIDAVSSIIDRYTREENLMITREAAKVFLNDLYWNHKLTPDQLVERAKKIAISAADLDAYTVTAVSVNIQDLPHGPKIANNLIQNWIDNFRANQISFSDDDNPFEQKVHHLIKAAIDEKRADVQARVSLYDVCEHISKHQGWGIRQKTAMGSATSIEFEKLIKELEITKLKILFRQMMDILTKKDVYGDEFGQSADRFVEACRNIVKSTTPDLQRLRTLILNLFNHARISDVLVDKV